MNWPSSAAKSERVVSSYRLDAKETSHSVLDGHRCRAQLTEKHFSGNLFELPTIWALWIFKEHKSVGCALLANKDAPIRGMSGRRSSGSQRLHLGLAPSVSRNDRPIHGPLSETIDGYINQYIARSSPIVPNLNVFVPGRHLVGNLLSISKTVGTGDAGQLDPGVDIKLCEDASEVSTDCVSGDKQSLRRFAIGEALCDKARNGQLRICNRVPPASWTLRGH